MSCNAQHAITLYRQYIFGRHFSRNYFTSVVKTRLNGVAMSTLCTTLSYRSSTPQSEEPSTSSSTLRYPDFVTPTRTYLKMCITSLTYSCPVMTHPYLQLYLESSQLPAATSTFLYMTSPFPFAQQMKALLEEKSET